MRNSIVRAREATSTELPEEATSLLPYVPAEMTGRRGSIASYRHSFRSRIDRLTNDALVTTAGMVMGAMGGLPALLLSKTLEAGHEINVISYLAAGVSVGAASVWSLLRFQADGSHHYKLNQIRQRIDTMTSKCADESRLEAMKSARQLAESPDVSEMETLMQLDAVAIALDKALHEAGPDAVAAARSQDLAERAIVTIMAQVPSRKREVSLQTSQIVLEQVCASLTQGSTLALAAPTARIARVLALAEKALLTHPDLVDDAGGRIDHLVRVHVPRLISLRTEAIDSARSQDIDSVDAAFSVVFDGVVTSIEEGIASIHDEAMERLATEMRFLSSRRDESARLSIAS